MKVLERGYTLLELIVVIAILTGLSAVLLVNSGESKDLIRLNNAARELETFITLAQSYGNSGKAFPEGDTAPEAFDRGYGVHLDKDSGTVTMYGGLVDDGDADEREEQIYDNNAQLYQSIELDGGTTVGFIDPTTGNNAGELDIFFKRGQTDTRIYSTSPNALNDDAIITLELNSFTADVVVNKTGLIYIDE